ncbi:hypothetical protein [Lacunimicrobium album]
MMLGAWSFLYWIAVIGGSFVGLLVIGVPLYLWLGSQTLEMVTDLSQKQARLNCWHCGKETSSERTTCQYCAKELR